MFKAGTDQVWTSIARQEGFKVITWLHIYLLMPMPTVILGAMAALPTREFNGKIIGGGPVREYLLNQVIAPVLPADAAGQLVQWFAQASVVQEWILSLLAIVNINAMMLPLLFVFGQTVIAISSWFARKNIELKRDAIRR